MLPFSEKWVIWACGERTWSEKVFNRLRGRRDYLLSIHLQLLWKYFIAKLPLSGRYFLARRVENWLCKYISMISLFFPWLFFKSLQIVKNKSEKTTFNQCFSCVDLWRYSSGSWIGWIYYIFPLWVARAGQTEWENHISLLIFSFESENTLSRNYR